MKTYSLAFCISIAALFSACQTAKAPDRSLVTKVHTAARLRMEPKGRVSPTGGTVKFDKGPHELSLLNFSAKWTCIQVSLDGKLWANVTPPVARTCDRPADQLDQCFKAGKYAPLGLVNCGQPIYAWLRFTDAHGNIGTLQEPYHWVPLCNKKGTVLPFSDLLTTHF